MSSAWQFYITTLIVYTGVNVIGAWGLNLQFGLGGVLNFAFVVFQAVGAYIAGVLALGPADASGGYQHYILGATLPWPLPILAAAAAGAALAFVVGVFALRPKRQDYQGMVLLTVALIATIVITSQTNIFNGSVGIVSIPHPLESQLNLGLVQYSWFYAGLTLVIVAIVYAFVHRLTGSPWGRTVRAMRENPVALQALGTNTRRTAMKVFVLGGAITAVSGAVLVEFISAWAPGSWTLDETFIVFVAIIIGGLGNNFGSAVGTLVVLTVLIEGVQYLPTISIGTDGQAAQEIVLGLLILGFLYAKPRGLIPERRRRFASAAKRPDGSAPTPPSGASTTPSGLGGQP